MFVWLQYCHRAFNCVTCSGAIASRPAIQAVLATPFPCPTCGAQYKLVRVKTKEIVPNQQMTCRKCGAASSNYVFDKRPLAARLRLRPDDSSFSDAGSLMFALPHPRSCFF